MDELICGLQIRHFLRRAYDSNDKCKMENKNRSDQNDTDPEYLLKLQNHMNAVHHRRVSVPLRK